MTPDFVAIAVERKGSLLLRSNHMKYGSSTLNYNWHSDREAEPKDYDICCPENGKQNLLKSTYERIGNLATEKFSSTSHETMAQRLTLRTEFEEQHTQKPMINKGSFSTAAKSIAEGSRETAVLPQHPPDYNKQCLETTHRADYKSHCNVPVDQMKVPPGGSERTYKRRVSEFTDAEDFKRKGLHIWQDD